MEPMDNERPENPNVREARRHARAAREEWRKSMEAWLPPGVAEHSRAARREFLLGIRSMINAAIDRLDRMDREEPKNTTGENTPPSSSTL